MILSPGSEDYVLRGSLPSSLRRILEQQDQRLRRILEQPPGYQRFAYLIAQDKCLYQILCRDKCHRGTIADGGKTAAETSARAEQKHKRD
jgi:hypothetical protein